MAYPTPSPGPGITPTSPPDPIMSGFGIGSAGSAVQQPQLPSDIAYTQQEQSAFGGDPYAQLRANAIRWASAGLFRPGTPVQQHIQRQGVPSLHALGTPIAQVLMSPDRALDQLSRMSAAQRRQIQTKLFNLGFYGHNDAKKIAWGKFDRDTISAFSAALSLTLNTHHRDLDLVLSGALPPELMEALFGGGGGGGRQIPPLSIVLTAPEDLKKAIQQQAQDIIGRAVKPKAEQEFVSEFHQEERQFQTAAHRAQYSGGTATKEPSLGTVSEDFLRRVAPKEAEATDILKLYRGLLQMMGMG